MLCQLKATRQEVKKFKGFQKKMNQKTVVVLHATRINDETGHVTRCPDATAALWGIARMFNLGDKILSFQDIEIVWQKHLPNSDYEDNFVIPFDYVGRKVVFADFCYGSRTIMQEIASKAKNLLILDHHEDKEEVIKYLDANFPNTIGRYSPKEDDCGATVVWKYFFPDTSMPWFLQHVHERDCGINGYYYGRIPKSEAFNNWLTTANYKKSDFECMATYDHLLELDAPTEEMIDLSNLKERNDLCAAAVKQWMVNPQHIDLGGYTVPLIQIFDSNCDRFYSYCAVAFNQGMEQRNKPNNYEFICIKTTTELKTFHLRRFEHSTIKVNTVAKLYGGGGHAGAAGFTIQ